jgi:uncharacterized membrane protein
MIVCDGATGFLDVLMCQVRSVGASFLIIIALVTAVGGVTALCWFLETIYIRIKRKKRARK